jgi:hypothetical protein
MMQRALLHLTQIFITQFRMANNFKIIITGFLDFVYRLEFQIL